MNEEAVPADEVAVHRGAGPRSPNLPRNKIADLQTGWDE
jgi:hypothetical protein